MNLVRTARVLLAAGLIGLGTVAPAAASGPHTPAQTVQRAVERSTTTSASRLGAVPASSFASASARRCARQFDAAVQAYMSTTQRRDATGFNALLHPDVTIIFANGSLLVGKRDSAAWIRDFFADPGWTQSFTELRRQVEGCRTGFVLFDSVYAVPAENRSSPLVIGVTFTYAHGTWLVLHNQDSTGPSST